jgi:iron complex outermembrane receptor protein
MRSIATMKFLQKPSVIAVSLCLSNAALAQEAKPAVKEGEKSQQLEEVVVTAQFRKENAQKAAISMTVLGGDDLGERGIVNVKDIINAVPGIAITSATPNANLSLRGVGSGGGNAYADPTVSFNLGGVNIARQFTTVSSFYDLQRIEILKGPQGTLYGRNATVGALNVVPNLPSSKYAAEVGVDIGNYKTFNTSGMLNSPISDNLAVRIAFKSSKHDGFLTNGYNDADTKAGRLSVLAKPASDLSVLFSADYFDMGGKGPSTVFLYPQNSNDRYQDSGNPWFGFGAPGCGNVILCPNFGNTSAGAANFLPSIAAIPVVGQDGYQNNQQLVTKLEIEKNLGFATLTVIPANVNTKIDFKAYGQGFQQIVTNKVQQNTLEARLASNDAKPWKWLLGAFYFSESQDSTGKFMEPVGYSIIRSPNLDDKSTAVFGQATYSLSDAARVTGGIRATSEKKSQNGFTVLDGFTCTTAAIAAGSTVVLPNPEAPIGGCSVPNGGETSFKSTDYKVGLELDVAPQSLLYVDASSGFKAGGFWAGLPPNSYKPEKLTAYSIGSKNRFMENRLQANLEIFYWKYKDQQISVFTGILPAGQTARPFNSDGYIRGAELDVRFLVTDADRVTLNLLNTSGQYDAFPLGTNVLAQVVNNFAANMPRLNTPRTSLTAGYERTWDLSGGGGLAFAARTHYESDTTLSALAVAGTPGAVLTLPGAIRPAYHVSSLSLSYSEPKGKWQMTGYIDNVENEAVVYTGTAGTISRGIQYRPTNGNSLYAALAAPRTFGVRIQAKF